jgi:Fur family zinc uptake transcriptional regulator
LCEARGRRLTALRRRVLEIVWRSHAPIGAYAVLDLLAAERGRVTPPTVYRALEFLAREGLVHRLDTLNAFVGCSRPAHGHAARFLICGACGVVHEFEDAAVDRALAVAAALAGFAVDRQTVEIRGRCGPCRAAVPAS